MDSVAYCNEQTVYLAFLDVLGFGSLVLSDWVRACSQYAALISATNEAGRGVKLDTDVQMISDSIIIKGGRLKDVVLNTQFFLQGAIRSKCLIRGAISAGRHRDFGGP